MTAAPETYFDALCCDTDLCNTLVPRNTPLTCYIGSESELMTYNVTDPLYVCARYGFACVEGEKSCTAAEISAKANKTAFIPTTSENCNLISAAPETYFDVLCCNANLCNAPVVTPNAAPTGSAPQAAGPVASTPKASFGSIVVPSGALLISAIACFF